MDVEVGLGEAGLEQRGAVLVDGDGPGDAPCPRIELLLEALVERIELDHVRNSEYSAGPEHSKGLLDDGAFVLRQVDDAVRDHDVDRRIREGDVLDRASQESGIANFGLGAIRVRQSQHLVGHVDAICVTAWADSLRRKQHVEPGSRAQVKDDLPGFELRQHRRVSAPEADRFAQPYRFQVLD